MEYFFLLWRHYLQIGSKRTQTCISCSNGDRKMNVNSKDNFEMKYYFLKPVSDFKSWSFDSRGNVIKPKMGQKLQIGISCTNDDRNMKINSKMYFEVNHSFMKLFSQNPKILAPYCEVIISKLGQKDSNFYIMYGWH